jgi:hypothetical protein
VTPIILQYPKSQIENWIPLNPDNVKFLVVHHPEAVTATPDEINDWHLANGWKGGAGYNEYIRKDGTVYIMRGDRIGAQCQGFNSISYGICCEGNYDITQEMSTVQYQSLMERVKFNLSRFPKNCVVVPHKQLNATECPGKYFPMLQLLSDISAKEVIKVDWKQIIEKVSTTNSADWEKAINTLVSVTKSGGDLGDLGIFQYLPQLIEKIYKGK